MALSKYSNSVDYLIGIYPLDDNLPLYSREAELFSGNTEAILSFVRGIEHRNEYLSMLKAITDKKIKNLENKYIQKLKNEAMLSKILNPDKPIDRHASDFIKK